MGFRIKFAMTEKVELMGERCYIAGAGEFDENVLPESGDFIIAADGGYAALTKYGITPDLIVGDFDSLPPEFTDAVANHPNVIRSNAEKDDTDMLLAAKQGLERGYEVFVINGGLGGRLDQTIANMQILEYLENRNACGTLVGRNVVVTMIRNSEAQFTSDLPGNSTVSIFCVGEAAKGVTLEGLKYPLTNATITSDYPIGVSNEAIGKTVKISVTNGTLLIIISGGNP